MAESETNLHARLIKVGVDLVASEGTQALSLREIARRAGVSHGAPRRYFRTHAALLAAIAREGYQQLGRQVAELADGHHGDGDHTDGDHGDPRARLLTLSRLYLDFARSNPGMFELMFRHDLLRGQQIGLRDVSRPLFDVLVDLVARARPHACEAPTIAAGVLWANLHGLAQLWQWGSLQMAVQTEDVDLLVRAAVDAHLGTCHGRPLPPVEG